MAVNSNMHDHFKVIGYVMGINKNLTVAIHVIKFSKVISLEFSNARFQSRFTQLDVIEDEIGISIEIPVRISS